MAIRTSTATGLFSAGATWVGGVAPVDGDAFIIANTHTVTFDMDQSAWAGMASSTINAGGTLIASTTAGAYVLKVVGNLNVNGTLQVGTSVAVPYPSTCTFTLDFSGGTSVMVVGSAGKVYLYCTEPSIKYALLLHDEVDTATEIHLDRDVSAVWASGDSVRIDNVGDGTSFTANSDADVINGVPAVDHIHITTGLTGAKRAGSYVFLVTRNIKITNSTGYVVTMTTLTTGCYIAAEFSGNTYGLRYGNGNTIAGIFSGGVFCLREMWKSTVSAILTGGTNNTSYGYANTFSGISSGSSVGLHETNSTLLAEGIVTGCTSGVSWSGGAILGTLSKNSVNGINNQALVTGNISGHYYGLLSSTNFILANCTLDNTTNFVYCRSGKCFNVAFIGTENSGYNSDVYIHVSDYLESNDHDEVSNALKAWCLGGIVTSSTTDPPDPYTMWYAHNPESATYPCFRQWQYTIASGETLIVTGKMRIPAATDMSANPPKFQIIDFYADPLMDATQSPLATMSIPVSDGTNTSWQDMAIAYQNTGASPKLVYIRITATHATQQVDECVYVPDMPAQVSDMYTNSLPEVIARLKRIGRYP